MSFFLLFQLVKENSLVEESIPKPLKTKIAKEKPIKTHKPVKEKKKTKKEKNKKLQPDNSDFQEEMDWDNFGIVERDKGVVEDQKEMDAIFFEPEAKVNDKPFETTKAPEAPKRPLTLEEEFDELFSDDEKEEPSIFVPDPQPPTNDTTFDDLSDFDNFSLDDNDFNVESPMVEEPKNTELEEDDTYDFLKNYDFGADDKESIDDDIFSRARSGEIKTDPSISIEEEEDWDFESFKNDLPPIEGVNYNQSSPKVAETIKSTTQIQSDEDDEDDIFARLQRLSNMMDQQKK